VIDYIKMTNANLIHDHAFDHVIIGSQLQMKNVNPFFIITLQDLFNDIL
jgi:hypothetical protein